MKGSFIIIAFLIIGAKSFAQDRPVLINDSINHVQNDSLIIEGDPIENAELIEMKARQFDPRKAGLYSAVLPGLGQAYNKKYWKMPIIYGGFIGLAYGIDFYHNQYNLYRGELFEILETGAAVSPILEFNEDQLRARIQDNRRERDFLIVLTAVLYFLNIADAHIDAHLKEFDLNEKLKLVVDPALTQPQNSSLQAGLSLSLKF